MNKFSKHWDLYWVASDGIEDCFVVARNSRSACSVECRVNGFDLSEVQATKIMRIPEPVERAYQNGKRHKEHPWPWYAYGKNFLKDWERSFERSRIETRCY